MENLNENGTVQEQESPFLNLTSFKQRDTKNTTQMVNSSSIPSPFKSVYELEGESYAYNEENEAFVEIMDELYDEEFDEILQEIANEAQELYENHHIGSGGLQNEIKIKQSLDEHFAPLLNEVDRFMDHIGTIADQQDTESMTNEEWENLVDQYVPQIETSPAFEDFGGWLKKKWKKVKNKVKKVARTARRAVKKGISIAKKLGFGFIIKRLKRVVMKFLKGFLKKGINKLPNRYKPVAQKLAKKIGILREAAEEDDYEFDSYHQEEFDGLLAEMLLAPSEIEMEIIEQKFINEADAPAEDPLDQLDDARENFIKQVGELNEGESVAPALEEFVPAVLMGLKLGMKVIGRKKVKNTFINLLSRLIQKYIGRKYARMLAKYMVNTGFRMLNLELTPDQEIKEGNRAIAAVIEETIRQIAQLPEHTLQNEALLENNVIQAFEKSAKANFPDVLSEETYVKRPDLREASKYKVAWKMKTLGRGTRKKCRYKKLNREIETELTPYLAEEIKTFGGVSLGNILKDQMGVLVNRNIPIKVHLYESLPGVNIRYIGRNENGKLTQQIHPLTSVAAGLLLGEPALGCKSTAKCLANKNSYSAHRYYYLEIPGARPQMYTAPFGVQYLRKTSGLKVKLNFVKKKIQLFLFLSEIDAQSIAAQMRLNMVGNAAQLGTMALGSGLKIAFSKHTTDHILVVHPNVVPGKKSGMAMNYVPTIIQNVLSRKLKDWATVKLSEYFMNNSQEFIEATDADADGVTICITLNAPLGFEILGRLINSDKVQISENIFSETNLEIEIKTKPGYKYV